MSYEVIVEGLKIAAAVVIGLGAVVPAVYWIARSVRDAVVNRDWNKILQIVIGLMAEAETKIDTGAGRKEWVLGMARTLVTQAGYQMTAEEWQKISDMIDALCTMAKSVNVIAKT